MKLSAAPPVHFRALLRNSSKTMRVFPFLTCCILLTSAALVFAAPEPTRSASRQTSNAEWGVRVEVLMVAMPQDKLLPLLPDLRDPGKIDGAVTQLLAAVQRKEAILTGYPVVHATDGKRSVSDTFTEKRYPTEFEPPAPQSNGAAAPPPAVDATAINEIPMPRSYETRNSGVTLEVEPHVSNRGESMSLDVTVQRVELLGFDSYDATRTASGKILKIDQPLFFTTRANTTVTAQNGQHILIGVHMLPKPENHMEVFILQATATPIK